MKYLLGYPHKSYDFSIEIKEKEFIYLNNEQKNIVLSLLIEEKFNFMISNFFDYEKCIRDAIAKYMMFGLIDMKWFNNERLEINRQMINLFGSFRIFLEHSCQHISSIYGKESQQLIDIIKETNNQYDAKFSYRLIDSLRNYVFHRAFPIRQISYPGRWIDFETDQEKLKLGITPYVIADDLIKEKGSFKPKLREEIKGMGKIRINPLIREYTESLWLILEKIREVLKKDLDKWDHLWRSFNEKYKEKTGVELHKHGVHITSINDDGEIVENILIASNANALRIELVDKNRSFKNLGKSFVTSEDF